MSRIPSYRRHRPSKQAVVTLCGKDVYLGKYGTKESREAYATLIADYLKNKGEKTPPEIWAAIPSRRKVFTIAAAGERYLARSQARHRHVEYIHVRSMVKCLVDLFENERAASFGPAELREVRRAMIARGWSRTYVNDQIGRVKRMFKWLAAEPLIPITTFQSLLVVNGLRRGEDGVRETSPVRTVADSAVDATLSYLPEVVADMVRLQRITGMRPAELCMLRPCDVDRSGDVWLYRPSSHKTEHCGKDRMIFLGPKAQEVLLRYLARDAKAFCFQPRDSEAKRRKPGRRSKGFVFADHYDVTTYRRAIHRACDRAFPHAELSKVKTPTTAERAELTRWKQAHRWSPNRLRHSAATEIRREFGLEAAQIILGHAKADVTQVYAERDLAKGFEVARKIG